jgi:hypothetical protein
MASHAQLRRAIAYALDHGWKRDRTRYNILYRVFPSTLRVRSVHVITTDTIRPRIETVRELDFMATRNVSIRRAINVLRATYDDAGEPIA